MLQTGEKVPAVTVQDDQGQAVNLRDRTAPYVLYLYPKDDTPGCTREACSFRDNYGQFQTAGVDVFGLSADSEASHVKFRQKYGLPFRLLADPDHKLIESLGAWGEKKFMGKTYMGVQRVTFVVDPDGTIQKVYPDVKPDDHATQILHDLGKA